MLIYLQMPVELHISPLPFDLPPFRYKGRSREELYMIAHKNLQEAKAFWEEALRDILPLITTGPVQLELSIDTRNMRIAVLHKGIYDPLIIDAFDLFRVMDIVVFRVLWKRIRLEFLPSTNSRNEIQ